MSRHASCHLSSGLLIPQMMLFMAALARIWQLSKVLCTEVHLTYRQMYMSKNLFQRTASQWEEPVLPVELASEHLLHKTTDKHGNQKRPFHPEDLIGMSSTEGVPHDDKDGGFSSSEGIEAVASVGCTSEEDLGVALKRKHEVMPQLPTKKRKKQKKLHKKTITAAVFTRDPFLESFSYSRPQDNSSKSKKKKKAQKSVSMNSVQHDVVGVENTSVKENGIGMKIKRHKKKKKEKQVTEGEIFKKKLKSAKKPVLSACIEEVILGEKVLGSDCVTNRKRQTKKKKKKKEIFDVQNSRKMKEKVILKQKIKGSKFKKIALKRNV